MSALLLDDEKTWPEPLVQLLQRGLATLEAFYLERRRIAEAGLQTRISSPRNPYQGRADELLASVEGELKDREIVGFHCSRLCNDEIAFIYQRGMCPLSPENLLERVDRRIAAGDMPVMLADRLRRERQAAEPYRQMIWFIFSTGLLKDESGVMRLFRSWGGEALYNSHEQDKLISPVLRRIGKPCIVEASIPISDIAPPLPVSEWVARSFMSRRGIRDGHSPEGDGYIRCPLSPDRIRRVIRGEEADFGLLTNAATWKARPF